MMGILDSIKGGIQKLHVTEYAHLKEPEEHAPQRLGCMLILRSGRAVAITGMSISYAKHMRRSKSFGTVMIQGKREVLSGADIKQILPLPK